MLKQQYSKGAHAYRKNSVSTMDQRVLIMMLYDGAISRLRGALQAKADAQGMYVFHTHVVRAKSIVAELLASLNMEAGGEVARDLQRLYIYMFNQLMAANVSKDKQRITHVVELLENLREGWKGLKTEASGSAQGAHGVRVSMKH